MTTELPDNAESLWDKMSEKEKDSYAQLRNEQLTKFDISTFSYAIQYCDGSIKIIQPKL